MQTFRDEAELRLEGRRLSGVVMRYGEEATLKRAALHRGGTAQRECFSPGALHPGEAVSLNIDHLPLVSLAYHPGGGLRLHPGKDAFTFSAILPPIPASDVAVREYRAGRLSGVSVEFHAEAESRSGDLRIVQAGAVVGIALCRTPVYRGSTLELRQRSYARGRILTDTQLDCSCVGPVCTKVNFKPGAFDRILREVESGAANIQATTGARDAGHILGDTRTGTLRFDLVGPQEAAALRIPISPLPETSLPAVPDVDETFTTGISQAGFDRPPVAGALSALLAWFLGEEVAETPAGRDLAEAVKVAEVVARPIIDQEASTWEDIGDTRYYDEAIIRLLLIKAAPGDVTGWDKITVERGDELAEPETIIQPEGRSRRRRRLAWL